MYVQMYIEFFLSSINHELIKFELNHFLFKSSIKQMKKFDARQFCLMLEFEQCLS